MRSDNAQWLRNFRQSICSLQKLFALMRSTHHGAQPCLALGHRRVSDRRRVHPCLEKLLRKLKRLRRISNMDWNNRGLASLKLKSALLQLALEKFRVRPQLLDQPLAFRRIQQSKGRLASRGSRRRVRSRKQERPRAQVQKIDQIARPANITAHRSD